MFSGRMEEVEGEVLREVKKESGCNVRTGEVRDEGRRGSCEIGCMRGIWESALFIWV